MNKSNQMEYYETEMSMALEATDFLKGWGK
jgi:hypothetical protein